MNFKAAFFLSVFAAVLSGCGAMVPVRDIYSLPVDARREAMALPIHNESQLISRKYSVLNVVEGISCKNKIWDPAATKTDAINQAKYWAKEQGADAIMNLQCDAPRGTTTTYNCWESITCTAQAVKLE
jgi:hypothetical protein